MAAQGSAKSGGRKKGTPNNRTKELKEIAEKLGVDPFEVLLMFAAGDWKALGYDKAKYVSGINEHGTWYKWTIDPAVRSKSAAEACQYLFPKRKAIEHAIGAFEGAEEASKELAEQAAKFLKLSND